MPPGSGRLNVWLVQVVVAPVDVRLAVMTIGPSGAPVRIWTAPSGDPAVRPSLLSATRNVTESMFSRLIGPLISIQSPAARLPRCRPPPYGRSFVPVFVPDWLSANSTCWSFCRTFFWSTVVSPGVPPAPAEVGVGGADDAPHVAAVRTRRRPASAATPAHPFTVVSAWPCESCASTNVTSTRRQSIPPSSGSVTVTVNGMFSPKANRPPSTGRLTVTVGEVLPAVIVVFADVLLPLESVTVSLAT